MYPGSSDRGLLQPGLRALVPFCVGVAIILTTFARTWLDMASVWLTSETFGHGAVVPVLSAWLAFRLRKDLWRIPAAPSWTGVALLVLAGAVWLSAELAGVDVVTQFAVTAMVPALVWALYGAAWAWALVVPLGFLFFMVPAGEALNPPLMEATADATILALRASGIPVFREGLHFALPSGRWSVVEACSGLRYVIAAAMLSTLFAVLNFERWTKRLVFVGTAIVVALVANWVRAYLIVMIGHLSGMRWGVGDDHVVYGWVFFGVVMLAVFWMGARWRDDWAAGPTGNARPTGARAPASAGVPAKPASLVPVALAIMVLLVGTRIGLDRLRNVEPRTDFEALAGPVVTGSRSGPFAMTPVFEGARGRVHATIDRPARLEAFAAYFARQEPGREMIGYGNTVLTGDWQPMSAIDSAFDVNGRPLPVREWRVRAGNAERLVWSWYSVGGFEAGGNEYRAKALTAWAMLTGRGDHSTVSVVGVDLPTLPSGARDAELEAALAAARVRLAEAAGPMRILSNRIVAR